MLPKAPTTFCLFYQGTLTTLKSCKTKLLIYGRTPTPALQGCLERNMLIQREEVT